ncbi:glycosyl transferase, WecB/TagA/CpsF family protein [Calothrix sp. NIES-4071]|nr:glycosyl transferase, WecB/TagA/CpsF family protein [Calothrix sp. NIES-4071]BAZ55830.1 glycosyl transferase, WecB/TagA/CpsF family protein [Calothrix sp. NIES-4105]
MKTFEEVNLLGTKFHKIEHRCPQWVSNIGLEWLSILLTEPQRLWKRYIIGNPLFFYRFLREQFLKQLR